MKQEADGHSVDEDGLCRYSDLRPENCADHWAGGRSPANRVAWSDLGGSPSNSSHRDTNNRSLHGATRQGEPWTAEEDRFLRGWKGTYEEAARQLHRTCEGVHMRLVRLNHGLEYR